jgi:aminoglycoside N3'-acetyltransferase
MGIISEKFQSRCDTISGEGTFRVCAWGKDADLFIEKGYNHLIKTNGYVLLLGVDYTRCSSLHISENVPLPQPLEDYFTIPKVLRQLYPDDWFIGYHEPPDKPFLKAGLKAEAENMVNSIKIGNATCKYFRAKHVLSILEDYRRNEPYWLMGLQHLESNQSSTLNHNQAQ